MSAKDIMAELKALRELMSGAPAPPPSRGPSPKGPPGSITTGGPPRKVMSAFAKAPPVQPHSRTRSLSAGRRVAPPPTKVVSVVQAYTAHTSQPREAAPGVGGGVGSGPGEGQRSSSGGSATTSTTSSTAPAPVATSGMDAMKRELRRTSEAYFALLRESKASKAAWEEREAALVGEVSRLKSAVAALERYKREHGEVLAAAVAGRDVASVAVAQATAAREAEVEARRGREGAERRAAEASFTAKLATDRAVELGAAGLEVMDARGREAALVRRAEVGEARAREATAEKEALLDFVQSLQRKLEDSYKSLAESQALASSADNLTARCTQLQALYDAQRATSGEMERSLKDVLARAGEAAGEVESLREAARRGEELQVQAVELKDTVMQQEGEIRALKAEAVRSGRDERRLVRLERAVAAYGRVESAFAARTGQGFFGVNGLAFAMGLDMRTMLSDTAVSTIAAVGGGGGDKGGMGVGLLGWAGLGDGGEGNDVTRALSSVDAGTRGKDMYSQSQGSSSGSSGSSGSGSSGAASSDTSALEGYLQRVAASFGAEARAEAAKEFSIEREALQGRLRESDARCVAGEAECARAWKEVEGLRAWKARCVGMEEELGALLHLHASSSSEEGEGGSGATQQQQQHQQQQQQQPLTLSSPLLSSPWDLSPSLTATLPKMAAVCSTLRSTALSAMRRLRLSEGEAEDLREELALAQGEDVHSAALNAARVHSEVVKALREGKAAREEMRGEIAGLEGALRVSEERVLEGERALALCAREAEAWAGRLAACEAGRREEVRVREEVEAKVNGARREAALHETRWREASDLNERALALLGEKDGLLARKQLVHASVMAAAKRLGEKAVAAGVVLEEELAWLRGSDEKEGGGGGGGGDGTDSARPLGDSPPRAAPTTSRAAGLESKAASSKPRGVSLGRTVGRSAVNFDLENSLSSSTSSSSFSPPPQVRARALPVTTTAAAATKAAAAVVTTKAPSAYTHLAAPKHAFYSENWRGLKDSREKAQQQQQRQQEQQQQQQPQTHMKQAQVQTYFVSPEGDGGDLGNGGGSSGRRSGGGGGGVHSGSRGRGVEEQEEGEAGEDNTLLSLSFDVASPPNLSMADTQALNPPSSSSTLSGPTPFRGRYNSSVAVPPPPPQGVSPHTPSGGNGGVGGGGASKTPGDSAPSPLETVLSALVANATEFARRLGTTQQQQQQQHANANANTSLAHSTTPVELSMLLARSPPPTPSSSQGYLPQQQQQQQQQVQRQQRDSPPSPPPSTANSSSLSYTRRVHDAVFLGGIPGLRVGGGGGGGEGETASMGALQRTLARRQKEASRSIKTAGREKR